jgi:ArsR family transcriptional regulator
MTKRSMELTDASAVDCCAPLNEGVMSEDDAYDLAGVLAALGDPVRLRMMSMIAASDGVCSCNLEGPLAKSQPTISHHTRVLVEAGLIVGEKRGRWTWWRTVPERLEMVSRLLQP